MTDSPRQLARRPLEKLVAMAVATVLAVAVQSATAAVKVRYDASSTFDFSTAHTWGWNPASRGQVLLARTPDESPEVVRQRAEPTIVETVSAEMPRRGLRQAATGSPDLTLTYYLLLSYGSAAQTLGQFLPAVADWGLPPFAASTQSLEVIEQGSLVLDLSANGEVVWRGVGAAKLEMGLPQDKRNALLRQAVTEIVKRYPPKKK